MPKAKAGERRRAEKEVRETQMLNAEVVTHVDAKNES
jgi:hypothetical protein